MNLKTNYMGLQLRSPIVVSACSLSGKIDNILLMEDHGAGAVVLFSLFEEQLNNKEEPLTYKNRNQKEAQQYYPKIEDYHADADAYLALIQNAKEKTDIPIIASLNGTTDEGWLGYAQNIAEAGADGLELNIYYIPGDFTMAADQVERRYLDIVYSVKSKIDIPIAVKISPYFSSIGNFAFRLQKVGANGLVMFNRFYQPDYDIYKMEALRNLDLSTAAEIRLPLRWIAMLSDQLHMSIGATSGVHSETEVIKYLLAGADVAMTASALYKKGIKELSTMQQGLKAWMNRMEYGSIEEFKGSLSLKNIEDSTAIERANYLQIIN